MAVYNSDELCHYGVQGMKWGIRRFQNKDGTLTTAGKKHYSSKTELRKDIKADNKKAKELGIQATVDTRAVGFAEKKYSKALKKYEKAKEKNPESKRTARLKKEYDAAKETRNDMITDRNKSVSEMNKHYQSLIKKYGKEYVKDIKYNKKGELREGRDAQKMAAQIVAYFGAASIANFAGFGVAVAPKTTNQMANEKVMWKNYEHLKGEKIANRLIDTYGYVQAPTLGSHMSQSRNATNIHINNHQLMVNNHMLYNQHMLHHF